MPEPNARDRELTLSATSGEGLSKAVLDRIERACAKAREEGRQEPKPHDEHVIEKRRRHGDRDGEVSYYLAGPQRATLEEAEADLAKFLEVNDG